MGGGKNHLVNYRSSLMIHRGKTTVSTELLYGIAPLIRITGAVFEKGGLNDPPGGRDQRRGSHRKTVTRDSTLKRQGSKGGRLRKKSLTTGVETGLRTTKVSHKRRVCDRNGLKGKTVSNKPKKGSLPHKLLKELSKLATFMGIWSSSVILKRQKFVEKGGRK